MEGSRGYVALFHGGFKEFVARISWGAQGVCGPYFMEGFHASKAQIVFLQFLLRFCPYHTLA
jgi:hypothetical protein